MISYLDTSFLLKAYLPEIGSHQVSTFLGETPVVLITALTDLEIYAAIYRKLTLPEADLVIRTYQEDRDAGLYQEVAMSGTVYVLARQLAKEFCGRVRMRSLDLLHLATALHHDVRVFATFDEDLGTAAMAVGLSVIGARP